MNLNTGACQVHSTQYYDRNCPDGHQRNTPPRQAFYKAHRGVSTFAMTATMSITVAVAMPTGCRIVNAGDCEQWKQSKHRDDRDILRQKNREGRSAARCGHQALFVQRLHNDRCRAERESKSDCQGNRPALTKQHSATHDRHCRNADLHTA